MNDDEISWSNGLFWFDIYASTKGTEMLCAWDRKGRRLHPYSQRCKEMKVVNKHMAMRNERSVE